jgi:hypothetical protein
MSTPSRTCPTCLSNCAQPSQTDHLQSCSTNPTIMYVRSESLTFYHTRITQLIFKDAWLLCEVSFPAT